MDDWLEQLNGDPLPWLLDESAPAVRHLALRDIFGREADDPDLVAARSAAMAADPIASILDAQDPEGWWVAPGPGYLPKYTATTWQLIFLDQMGADPADERVQRACEYVLSHTQTKAGGFGYATNRRIGPPPPSSAIHCLNGNLLRALIGFGGLDDPRVGRAIDWEVGAILGSDDFRYTSLVPGPGFSCGGNAGPCAWGATKAVLGLGRIPFERRTDEVGRALDVGVGFLLSRNPAIADYPMAPGATKPNGSWFKLGFPVGYVTDVLQVLEALCEAGAGDDDRLRPAIAWLLAQQDEHGRWANRYTHEGKLVRDVDAAGQPSRWVTLRACRVLDRVWSAREAATIA